MRQYGSYIVLKFLEGKLLKQQGPHVILCRVYRYACTQFVIEVFIPLYPSCNHSFTHTHTHTHTRVGHTVKSEDLHGDKTNYELRRQYHCMAYNMLIAVITCTQNKMQFYTGFLFKEDLIKVSV